MTISQGPELLAPVQWETPSQVNRIWAPLAQGQLALTEVASRLTGSKRSQQLVGTIPGAPEELPELVLELLREPLPELLADPLADILADILVLLVLTLLEAPGEALGPWEGEPLADGAWEDVEGPGYVLEELPGDALADALPLMEEAPEADAEGLALVELSESEEADSEGLREALREALGDPLPEGEALTPGEDESDPGSEAEATLGLVLGLDPGLADVADVEGLEEPAREPDEPANELLAWEETRAEGDAEGDADPGALLEDGPAEGLADRLRTDAEEDRTDEAEAREADEAGEPEDSATELAETLLAELE